MNDAYAYSKALAVASIAVGSYKSFDVRCSGRPAGLCALCGQSASHGQGRALTSSELSFLGRAHGFRLSFQSPGIREAIWWHQMAYWWFQYSVRPGMQAWKLTEPNVFTCSLDIVYPLSGKLFLFLWPSSPLGGLAQMPASQRGAKATAISPGDHGMARKWDNTQNTVMDHG